jgi:cytochrome P450
MSEATHSARTLPPGPRGMPILGMLPAVRRDPAGVFMRAAQRFGEVVYFKIGPRRGYLITNPADVRHVLQDNARNYHKSPLYEKLKSTLGNGLLTSEGEFWLRQRRIAQPAFHRQRIAALARVMAESAQETAHQWERIASDGQPVDVAEEMMRLTRTVVLRALLGADLGPFTDTIDEAWAVINERRRELLVAWIHRPFADAEVPAVPGRERAAQKGGRSRHQPTPAASIGQPRSALNADDGTRRRDGRGHVGRAAAG